MTERDIQRELLHQYWPVNKYAVSNCYLFDWESDFVMITRAGYVYEFEIKISKQDFRNDFKKQDRHQTLQLGIVRRPYSTWVTTGWVLSIVPKRPNYFIYCCPVGLLQETDVPPYAGLYEVSTRVKEVKAAPRLHRVLAGDSQRTKILESAFYRFNNQQLKAHI